MSGMKKEMSFACHDGILYLRIGDDVYEVMEDADKGQGTAVHFLGSHSNGSEEEAEELLSDMTTSETDYTLVPCGRFSCDKNGKLDIVPAGDLPDIGELALRKAGLMGPGANADEDDPMESHSLTTKPLDPLSADSDLLIDDFLAEMDNEYRFLD